MLAYLETVFRPVKVALLSAEDWSNLVSNRQELTLLKILEYYHSFELRNRNLQDM